MSQALKPKRILLVDDDEGLRRAITRLLQRDGHEVCSFGRSIEAMMQMEGFRPDVVITDLVMPYPGAREILSHAASAAPQALRIVMTGMDPEEIQGLMDAHFIVAKSQSTKELLSIIHSEPPLPGNNRVQSG